MPRHSLKPCLVLPLIVLIFWIAPVTAQQPAGGGANNTLSASESAAGWMLLFDGRTLSGWTPTGASDWKVEDGTITATTGAGFLAAPGTFGNFEFKTDFWPDKTVNSGVFFRCGAATPGAPGCYEANIFDAHDAWPTGSVNNVQSTNPNRLNTTERWNTLELTAEGSHLIIKINGKTTVDARDEKLTSGAIRLQEGGANGFGLVRFRNIQVRPL